MTNAEIRFQQLIAALKVRGYRLTPQRVELVRMIATSEGHPSANMFYERIQKQFPTMSRATVYKTLHLLKEIGQVFEIDLREDSHYDGNRPEPHPHLVCEICARIMDAETNPHPDWIRALEVSSGYTITRPQITLYGTCPVCKEAAR